MKSLLASVLIVTTITASLVDGQIENRFFYKNRDESADENTNVKLLEENNTIPLHFFEEINKVNNWDEFIEKFVDTKDVDPKLGIQLQSDNTDINQRAKITRPVFAMCEPENTVVPLVPINTSKDPSVTYYPSCTRVKRCGGCCSTKLLSCQPTEVSTIDFTIYKLEYRGGTFKATGFEHALVEQHNKCSCQCRIKKDDCNSYQIYDAQQCKCNCTNYAARDKCQQSENKIWDYNTCKCKCKETQECTTGTYFDDHVCACTEIYGFDPSSTVQDRKRFFVKAVPVEPSNATLYSTDGE